MINKERLNRLEKKHSVGSAVVIVRAGETLAEAKKRYEKKNKINLAECKEAQIIYDNI